MKRKILLVEDEAIIAMTTAKMIEKHGFEVVIAYKGEKAVEIVEKDHDISLILMDIDLGQGIDGTEASERILEKYDIPIAFLSSHTEPEIVEKTEGITSYGYIVKNSGETVLLASIKMAFRLFEAKMNEKEHKEALLHSHDLMSYIIEHNQSAIAVHDKELNYIYVSRQYLNQYNVSKRDVIGHHHYEVFPDLPQKWRDIHKRSLLGEVISGEDDPYERDDGTVDWTRWECRPWYEGDGTIGGIIIYTEVITKEKRLNYDIRDNINYIQSILRTTRDGFWVLDLHGKFIDVNNAYCDMSGYSREEILRMRIPDIDVDEESEEAAERIRRVITKGSEYFEVRHRRKNGNIFNVEISASFLGGDEDKILCFCRDITERKKAELELQRSNKYLRTTLSSIGDAVISTDTNGNIEIMNPVAESLTGWAVNAAKGKSLSEVFHIINAESRKPVDNPVERVLQFGEIVGLANHTALISKEGHEYQIADSAAPIKDDEGNINGVVLVFRDVTEGYEKDRLINENEKKYRGLFNSIRDAILVADTDRKVIDCNPAFTELFGYSLEEIKDKKTVSVYKSEEEYSQMGKALKEHKGELKDFLFPVHYRRKDGTTFTGETNVFYLRDDTDELIGFIGLIHDITNQKIAQEELQKSKDRYKRLVNNSPNLIMETDVESHEIISCNPAMAKNLGTSISEIVGKKIDDFIPQDTLKKRVEVSQRAIETGEPQTLEDERNEKYFYTTYIPIIDNERRSVQTIVMDITERKKSENLIKEYANRLELTMEAANMAWWELHIKSGNVSFNRKKADMLGYAPDQFQHYNDFMKLVHPDDHEPTMSSMKALLKGGEDKYDIEYRIKAQSGEYRWFHDIGTITKKSEEGSPLIVAGIVFDITDRKQAEEKINSQNTLLSMIMETSPIGIVTVDKEGNLTYANKRAEKILGLVKEKITSITYDAPLWNHTDLDGSPLPDEKQPFNIVKTTMKTVYDVQHGITWPDGTVVLLSINASPMKDIHGNFNGMVATIENITDAKKNEQVILQQLTEKEDLMKELNHRVKNNLAMISSLISLKNSETYEDLSDLKHRIDVIKLVHEKLNHQNDVERIEVKEYFQELLESIFSSTSECDINLVNNIEKVSVPTKTAIPLGLVANEIATNAIKYGFTSDREARFTIEMKRDTEDKHYILTLSNSGNPFPEEIGLENPRTMGLQLVSTLVKQLNGTIELQKEPNPVFTIKFPIGEK